MTSSPLLARCLRKHLEFFAPSPGACTRRDVPRSAVSPLGRLGVTLFGMVALRANNSFERTRSAAASGFAGSALCRAAQLVIRYAAGHHLFSVASNVEGFGNAMSLIDFGSSVQAKSNRPAGRPRQAVSGSGVAASARRPLAVGDSDLHPSPLGSWSLSVCGLPHNQSLERTRWAPVARFADRQSCRAAQLQIR